MPQRIVTEERRRADGKAPRRPVWDFFRSLLDFYGHLRNVEVLSRNPLAYAPVTHDE
jgi:hypothetical protein